jgi:hypothetical protein
LRALRWTYATFIVATSAATALTGGHQHHIGLMLAVPECLAALAFLFDAVEVAACAVLLLVFTAASVLSLVFGDYLAPLRFLYFAVTAVVIVIANRRAIVTS